MLLNEELKDKNNVLKDMLNKSKEREPIKTEISHTVCAQKKYRP